MKHSRLPTTSVQSNLQTEAASESQGGEADSVVAAEHICSKFARGDVQREFVSRALVAREEAQRTGQYVSSVEMLRRLDTSLANASVRQIG